MSLRRIEGWEGRLAEFVTQARSRPFLTGEFDCCLMPCDAVEMMTGVDPAAALRGRFKTERGALRVLKRFAGGGITEVAEKIAAELGAPEVPIRFARRGDIVLVLDPVFVRAPWDALLGLCLGRQVAVMAPEGLRLTPMHDLNRAWAVG
jgi:hypothetical protein